MKEQAAAFGTGLNVATPSTTWRARADAWEFLEYALRECIRYDRQESTPAELTNQIGRTIRILEATEPYWAHPGMPTLREATSAYENNNPEKALDLISSRRLNAAPVPTTRDHPTTPEPNGHEPEINTTPDVHLGKPRFEVLIVGEATHPDADKLSTSLAAQRRTEDAFTYELNTVPSYEDAMVALLTNPDIQAVIIRPTFVPRSTRKLAHDLKDALDHRLGKLSLERLKPAARIQQLAESLTLLRPELDIYLVAGVAMETLATSLTHRFRRIFRREDHQDIHLSILAGVANRYETPFFTALQQHSRRPGSVFHALPISRGGSVINSPWISDMADFYGHNLLMAETSATSGGLDSLLDPHGSIKVAQTLAARAFGAQRTYFVTNGTSTANKIVHQSILAPDDIVLVDRNCHKSHHYALLLAGARVCYLDAYPLDQHSLYGAVPLENIKRQLLAYRSSGRLQQVKMIALTNCTFDGIVYDPYRVMEECLAINPDLVFLWDEAWFAFAGFHPTYRARTAMAAARKLEQDLNDPSYLRRHLEQAADLQATGAQHDERALRARLIPDPRRTRLRVYATQSTHKTLTSLRQGSMIHIYDQDFTTLNGESFREAFMTHTSTSPNYQILASLDIGRRQVEFEGYGLVQRQVDLALSITQAIARHPLLKKYFRVLNTTDLIPDEFRHTTHRNPAYDGLHAWNEAWQKDEFVIDPSRLTLDIGLTGVDGDTFKHEHLMNRHGIQVNKTSRNTVLFMTNIGTSRSSVAYLIEVLIKLAENFELEAASFGPREAAAKKQQVLNLTTAPPPLPHFSRFAESFKEEGGDPDGDLRAAYLRTYLPGTTDYLSAAQIRKRMDASETVVSGGFVTPYPPGFPVLVPGQVFTSEILDFMDALDTREIHGYHSDLGYRVLL